MPPPSVCEVLTLPSVAARSPGVLRYLQYWLARWYEGQKPWSWWWEEWIAMLRLSVKVLVLSRSGCGIQMVQGPEARRGLSCPLRSRSVVCSSSKRGGMRMMRCSVIDGFSAEGEEFGGGVWGRDGDVLGVQVHGVDVCKCGISGEEVRAIDVCGVVDGGERCGEVPCWGSVREGGKLGVGGAEEGGEVRS
eukprot:1223307-Rhodomonas_salina.1